MGGRSAHTKLPDPREGPTDALVVTKISPWSMADTIARLSAVVAARGLDVIAVIDHGDQA